MCYIITHNATPSLIGAEALGANVSIQKAAFVPWHFGHCSTVRMGEFRHTLLSLDVCPTVAVHALRKFIAAGSGDY